MIRKGFALIVILLIVAGIIAIGGAWYYTAHKSSRSAPSNAGEVNRDSSASLTELSSAPKSVLITSTSAGVTSSSGTPQSTSSSSAQIGAFTVVTDCVMDEQAGGNIIKQIDILKGDEPIQTISGNFDTELYICPSAQSQDVNFDGYPDILLNTGHGATGNEDLNYWLYSTSTGQFNCPNIPAGVNKPWLECTLGGVIPPIFNPASDTISMQWTEGCAAECSDAQTDQWINGELTLIKDVSVEPNGGLPNSPLVQTTEELINGQMVIVSTSTVWTEENPLRLPVDSSSSMVGFGEIDASLSQYANTSSDFSIVPVYQLSPATSTQSDPYSGLSQNEPGYYSSVQYNVGSLELLLNKGMSILYNGTTIATSSNGSSGGDNFDPNNAVTTFGYQGSEYFSLNNTDCEVAGCFSDISLYSLDNTGVLSGGRVYETNYGPDAPSGPSGVIGAIEEGGKLYIIAGPGPGYAIFILDGAGNLQTIAAEPTSGVISFPATVVPVSTSTVPLDIQHIASSFAGDGG